MKLLDKSHPFFQSRARRIFTVAAPAAWAMVEFWNGAIGWGFIFLAAAVYAGWELLVNFDASAAAEKPPEAADRSEKEDEG